METDKTLQMLYRKSRVSLDEGLRLTSQGVNK
jgi:hypothetical protein